jgi:uncharacterized protein (DUF1015 family)
LATLKPFRPYRYTSKAGDPADLLTQPYDKISPAMQAQYLAASPYNLVQVILGERFASDSDVNNVYTRSARCFHQWIQKGILAQDHVPGFYAYFQDFEVPDTGQMATRTGFIGLGQVEDYSAGIVHRHEQTLSGPKKDRRAVLDHTRAHFGQIFMLYQDRESAVEPLLRQAARRAPLVDVLDDYEARHRLWAMTEPEVVERIQEVMAPQKLLIADGHHRYETALAYRDDHPEDDAARWVMMTFVNMYSPGLKILATHRVLRRLDSLEGAAVLSKPDAAWKVTRFDSPEALKREMAPRETGTSGASHQSATVRIGMITADEAHLLERARKDGEMDVPVLHTEILGGMLGISEEAVREESYITYVRGMDAAVAEVREKGAQVAFLLDPTPIEDMARIAFGGGVMPQKSTDFYPKLLTGITIYKL